MSKKPLTREEVAVLLDKISDLSEKHGGSRMPGFIHGYLNAMLRGYADASPKIENLIRSDIRAATPSLYR